MLHYTKVKRKIYTGSNPGTKYLAVISRNGVMSQDQLIERIAGASALAENDVLSALRALQVVITDATMNGITVQLKELGNFTPYVLARAVDSEEMVDASTIKRVKVNFYPNKRFKTKLKGVFYEYRNPKPKGMVEPEELPAP